MKKPRTALPLPRYVRRKRLASGQWAHFFSVPTWARRAGCPVGNEALGTEYTEAVLRAERILLPAFDSWRTGGLSDVVPDGQPAKGSFDWLAAEFKASPKFQRRLGPRSRKDHDRNLNFLSDLSLKDGGRLGEVQIGRINEGVVDALYDRIRVVVEKRSDGTERLRDRLTTANHAMASAQRAWNVVRRLHSDIVPAINPFSTMEREASDRTTPAATLQQLRTFVAACDNVGNRSIGTAAIVAWDWCVREEHILGQLLDGAIRALPWSNYRAKEHLNSMLLVHWKTGERVLMPLTDQTGEPLFPELTARLDATPRTGPFIIMRDKPDRAGIVRPWVTASGDLTHFRHTVRKIMDRAGLPKDVTFASFRHGGLTEAADADLTDRQMKSLSGHRTADILDIYAKRTEAQRIAAARKRRDYRTKQARLSE